MQKSKIFTERLKILVGNEPVTSFAERASLSEGTLRNLLKGGDPKLSNAIRIAEAGNSSLGWLVGENDEAEVNEVKEQGSEYSEYITIEASNEFAQINLYEVNASAGHGSEVIENKSKLLYFRKEWFINRGLNPKYLVAVNVVGDSMEPEIPDESIVLVDTSQRDIKNGAVYVFTHNNDLLIKRMMATVDGYKAKSINPLYEDMAFDQTEADKLNVVGRAVRALPDIKL